jgi:hypothetical protein
MLYSIMVDTSSFGLSFSLSDAISISGPRYVTAAFEINPGDKRLTHGKASTVSAPFSHTAT